MNLIFQKPRDTRSACMRGRWVPIWIPMRPKCHQGFASPTAESQIRLVADFSRLAGEHQIIPREITNRTLSTLSAISSATSMALDEVICSFKETLEPLASPGSDP